MSEVVFTASQRDAVDIGRRHLDTCVVAGPGSGKTTVLVEYFKRLVEAGVDPLRILAITFTEKAAGNMRKKLAEAFRDDSALRAAIPESPAGPPLAGWGWLERAWVSTVHGFCARLLRENAVAAGVDPEFTVAPERDAWRMQQDAIAAAIDSLFLEDPGGIRALASGLSSMDFESALLGAYDAMRGAGMSVEEVAALPAPAGTGVAEIASTLAQLRGESLAGWTPSQREHFAAQVEAAERIVAASGPGEALAAIASFPRTLNKCRRNTPAYNLLKHLRDELIEPAQYGLITGYYASGRRVLIEMLQRFDRGYRERKRQAGALDFADLEEYTVRLLEDQPEARARLQAQFEHILMDEFQDTNGQQARLLNLIRAAGRFYAVGDINQSIFGFRHAEPEGFERYAEQVRGTGGHHVELRENFRSRAEILRAVETIAGGESGIAPHRLIPARQFAAPRPVAVELIGLAAGVTEEAQWVARRIAEMAGGEPAFTYQDMAVLVRNTEVLGAFGAAFDRAGIPYVVNRGRGFYDAREVNDLVHLLRVIANPRDEISLAAVLRSPLAGASDEAILQLRVMGENIGGALMRLADADAGSFGAADFAVLGHFRDRLREWRARRESVSFDRLLLAAMDDCSYRPEAGARGDANIEKFLAQAREAAAISLDAFVQELALVRAENPREPDAPPEDSANAVKVMTVHSAKGLEFPVVFLAALDKGVDTKLPVVAFSRAYGLGARWRIPGARKEKDDLFQHAIRDERAAREKEESNRLLYVAMTRAEQHLVLSFSGEPDNWAEVVVKKLGISLEQSRDEIVDLEGWKLRLLLTDRAPELIAAPPAEPIAAAEVELLPRPEAGGQHDAAATVTAVSTFAACPRKYYLGGYLGFGREGGARVGANGGISAAELGSQVHALLAGMAQDGADPEAARLAAVFQKSRLGRRAARAGRVEREFDFVLAVEDLVVHGQVDLWFEDGGEIVIVDYKTDAVSAAEAAARASDYALQLRIYAMAVERVAGKPPRHAYLHFLRPDAVVEVDLAPSLLESPEQTAREFQSAQETLEFLLHEGCHCRRCPFFRDLCPAGKDIPAAEERG
jgi:ATP-dependent helicase/nuclease subunit A